MTIDRFIEEFDRALRAIAGVANAARVSPGEEKPEAELDERDDGVQPVGRLVGLRAQRLGAAEITQRVIRECLRGRPQCG